MKPLSEKQARACESACTPRCRCRCGGAFHGKKRAAQPDRAFFESLPADDPHALQKTLQGELLPTSATEMDAMLEDQLGAD